MGNVRYRDGFAVRLHEDKLRQPVGKRADRIFVNSMSDLLHRDIPDEFIRGVFRTMGREAPQHEYQVLTKRADRWPSIARMVVADLGKWPDNVLPGVTVESRKWLGRLEPLSMVGGDCTVRMVSFEPLLSDLAGPAWLTRLLRDNRVGWAISGGESGPYARPAELSWFCEVRDACQLAGVPFFHKQHGGRGPGEVAKKGGALATLDGQLWKELPTVSLVQSGTSPQRCGSACQQTLGLDLG